MSSPVYCAYALLLCYDLVFVGSMSISKIKRDNVSSEFCEKMLKEFSLKFVFVPTHISVLLISLFFNRVLMFILLVKIRSN